MVDVEPAVAESLVEEGIVNKVGKMARGVLVDFDKVEGGKLTVRDGRFGVYINWKRVNAKMPMEYSENPTDISKEEAWAEIEAKIGQGNGKVAKKRKGKGSGKAKKAAEGKAAKTDSPDSLPPPKRPLSAYLLFCAAERPEVSKTCSKLGDVSKELARRWKELEDRTKFDAAAAEEKALYEKKKKEWEANCRASATDALAEVEALPTARKPTRRPSGYMMYCKEKRQSVMEMRNEDGEPLKFGEVTKVLAKQWKSLSDKEKEKWSEAAKAA